MSATTSGRRLSRYHVGGAACAAARVPRGRRERAGGQAVPGSSLEHGDDFAKEFIETTFKWAPYWLNERTLARRPWVHQKQYVKIDRLLAEAVPEYYARRRLESEYATLLTEDQ